jgi:hypothetical protein
MRKIQQIEGSFQIHRVFFFFFFLRSHCSSHTSRYVVPISLLAITLGVVNLRVHHRGSAAAAANEAKLKKDLAAMKANLRLCDQLFVC